MDTRECTISKLVERVEHRTKAYGVAAAIRSGARPNDLARWYGVTRQRISQLKQDGEVFLQDAVGKGWIAGG